MQYETDLGVLVTHVRFVAIFCYHFLKCEQDSLAGHAEWGTTIAHTEANGLSNIAPALGGNNFQYVADTFLDIIQFSILLITIYNQQHGLHWAWNSRRVRYHITQM